MKKLLIVMLVLAIAPMASAVLTLTGDQAELPAEIWLTPSETIALGATFDTATTGFAISVSLNNAQAELISDGVTIPVEWNMGESVTPIVDAENGVLEVSIQGAHFMGEESGPGILFDNLILHCVDDTDVILTFTAAGSTTIDGVFYAQGTELGSIIVHQPEPMTIALLGLGGLFLRRRK